MLLPDERGLYGCEYDDFKTDNIFEYMHHAGIEFDWMVKLSNRYNFNMFTFLEQLAWHMTQNNYEEVWHSIQGVSLLFVNSSGEDFEEFIKETETIANIDDLMVEIEEILKNGTDEKE